MNDPACLGIGHGAWSQPGRGAGPPRPRRKAHFMEYGLAIAVVTMIALAILGI